MTSKILNECLQFAQQHFHKHPQYEHYIHYTFIIQNNQLVEWGTNLDGNPPLHFGYNKKSGAPKLHSEFVAYKKGRGLLNNDPFDLVNIRVNRRGEVKISAPCFVCQEWLKSVHCSTVWFTIDGGKFGRIRL